MYTWEPLTVHHPQWSEGLCWKGWQRWKWNGPKTERQLVAPKSGAEKRSFRSIWIYLKKTNKPPFFGVFHFLKIACLTQRDWSLMRLINRGDSFARRTSGEVELETIMKHSAQAFLMPHRLSEQRSKNLGIYEIQNQSKLLHVVQMKPPVVYFLSRY